MMLILKKGFPHLNEMALTKAIYPGNFLCSTFNTFQSIFTIIYYVSFL